MKFPIGQLKVTRDEYEAAKRASIAEDAQADRAYQLIRYCRNELCILSEAKTWLEQYRRAK